MLPHQGFGSNSKSNSHDSDLDGLNFKRKSHSAHPEYRFNPKPKLKSSEHNEYPEWNSSIDMYEGSARKMPVDSRDSCKFMANHGYGDIRTSIGSSAGLRSPYVGKVDGEKVKPRFTRHNELSLKVLEKENLDCKPSDFKGSEYHNFRERELHKIAEKVYYSLALYYVVPWFRKTLIFFLEMIYRTTSAERDQQLMKTVI